MTHSHMVFHFVFEEAQKMITECNHLMQQDYDTTAYHRELKIRWKQAFSMLRMARDLAFVMDDEDNYEVEAEDEAEDENTDEDTDEEMPDLHSESGSEDEAQDAEMSEAQDTSEPEVESAKQGAEDTKQRAEGSGC
jgi:hypothetical protein